MLPVQLGAEGVQGGLQGGGRGLLESESGKEGHAPPPLRGSTNTIIWGGGGAIRLCQGNQFLGRFWYTNPCISDPPLPPFKNRGVPRMTISASCVVWVQTTLSNMEHGYPLVCQCAVYLRFKAVAPGHSGLPLQCGGHIILDGWEG